MKRKRNRNSNRNLRNLRNILLISGGSLLAVTSASADQTWDGGSIGPGDNNWNTAANWGLDALPIFTNAINFGGNLRNAAVNNLAADSIIGGINFTNNGSVGNTNAFTLSGNRIILGGNITTTANTTGSTITDIISLDMILNANRTITTNQLSASVQHNLTISGIISSSGAFGLTKAGAGTLTLTGANTYTGTTTISGGTLQVGNGTTGSLGATPSTFAGALTFNNSGGTFNVAEATGSTQSMGALTFTAGDGNVTSTAAGGAGNLATLTFASLAVRAVGATGNFTLAANTTVGENKILLTSTTNAPLTTGSNNAGLFFGGTEYARYDLTNGFKATAYGTDTNAPAMLSGTTIGATTIATDIKLNGAITLQTTATVNTINLGGANNFTFSNAANILSVNGILATAGATIANTTTVSTIRAGTSGGELVIRVDGASNTLGIQPIIANNTSASALTKSGAGTLNIVNLNTYTGATNINGGTLQIGGAGNLVAGAYAGAIAISQGANLTWASSAAQTLSGNITGEGSVILNNASAVLTLNNATTNNYSGGFTLSAGQVSVPVAANYYGFGTGLLTINGGSMRTGNTTGNINIANDVLWNANVAFGRASGGNPIFTFNGKITLGASVGTTGLGAAEPYSLTFNGNIGESSAGYGLNLNSTGTGSVWTFNGQNTFTGALNTNGKALVIGGSGYLGGGSYGAAISGNGTMTYSSSANQTLSGIITVSSLLKNTDTLSTLTLSGSSANVISGLTTVSAGTLELSKLNGGIGTQAITANGLTVGSAGTTAATVRYAAATTNPDMMGAGAVSILGRGILDFNGATDTIGNVAITATGAGASTTPIINTAGGGNLTIGTLGITPVAGFTSVINAGTGTITLGGNVTFNAATTGQAQISGTALALGTAGRTFTVNPGYGAGHDLLIDAQITGGQSLTKAGTGRLTLANTNTYTGGTTVSAGSLLLSGAFNMPGTGTLAVSTGGTFSLADGTARATTGATSGVGLTLATGSWLGFDWNAGSLDSFTTGGTATSTGTVVININNTSPTGSGGTLITSAGVSTLNAATYLLANNTNYTATISKTTTTVSIGAQTPATALTDAYWKGGQVTGALGTMTVSTGSLSNWASDAAGTSVGVTPGGSAVNVIFGATGATQQANVITGFTDMNLGSITFNDSAAVTIAGAPNIITLNSTSGTAAATSGALGTITNTGTGISAISVTSFANATNTISANLALGANQTWNVASGKTLVVSGIVSGTNTLTKAGTGTVALTGANTYTGTTTISGGTLSLGNNTATGSLSTSSAIVNNSNLTFNRNNAVTQGTDFAAGISGTGSVTQAGSSTLTLSGTNTYQGGTILNAGTLAITADSNLGTGGGITVNGTSTINGGDQYNLARTLTLNGGTLTLNNGFGVTGVFSGTGSLFANSSDDFNFTNAANTYTGAITSQTAGSLTYGLTFASIGDTAGAGLISLASQGTFRWTSASGTTTTLLNRQFAISAPGVSTTAGNLISAFGTTAASTLVINRDLLITGTAGARILRLAGTNTGNNTFAGNIADGAGSVVNLQKEQAGTWVLSGANSYTGGTSILAGTLIARSGSALGTTSTANVTVATQAGLVYYAKTDTALSIGGTLGITGGTTTLIGASIGSDFTTARINVAGNATTTAAGVRVNIYGNTFSTTVGGTGNYVLLQGGGTNSLDLATYTLGTVYNNTNFTVGAISKTANNVTLAVTAAAPITNAFWKGGLTGNTGVWAASNGSTQSNWVTTAGGGNQALIPTAISLNFSATTPGTMVGMTLGADMTVDSLIVSNTTTAFGLVNDGYKLTIAPVSAANGILLNAGLAASPTISTDIILGANQTWTNSSGRTFTVSGSISGSGNLTKEGLNTTILSGNNTYTGTTNVNAGTLIVNGNISSSSLTTVAIGATLGGSGTVGMTVVNGTLSVGNSPGQMNVTNTLALAGGTIMEVDGILGAGVVGGHDFVNLTGAGAAGVLTYGGTMTLDFGSTYSAGSYSWNLFDFTNETSTFTGITLADQYSGSLLDLDTNGIWDLTSGNNTWVFTESTGVLGLTVVVIPEPSTALLGGLGVFALLLRRRRD